MKQAYIFIYRFLAIIILVFLPVVVFAFVTSRWPVFLGIRSFTVLTGSMQPTLPVGSLVFVQKRTMYTKNEIISFENTAGQTVTHRIINTVEKDSTMTYQTKGDANNMADSSLVQEEKVIGAEVFSLPLAGYFIYFLKTPFGFFSSIIFPVTVFLVFEFWNLKKEIGKEIERKILKKIQSQ